MNVLLTRFAIVAVLLASVIPSSATAQSRIDLVQARIVKIYGAGGIRNLHSYSSGVMIDPRGYVMTVWNHVLDTPELSVVLHDGRRFQAAVVNAEPSLDLAVLKLESGDENFPAYKLQDARDVPVGTRVLAFSNMFKVAKGDEPVSVVHGVISARSKLSTKRGVSDVSIDSELYVIDAITNNAGSEGGLLTTLSGRPVALIGRQLRNAQTNTWVNYAVPLTTLRGTVAQIVEGRFTAKSTRSNDQAAKNFQPEDLGLVLVPNVVQRTPGYVDSVLRGSVSETAGIQREDLLVFVNDRLVRSCSEVRDAVGGLLPGRQIEIVVRRGDTLKTFQIETPRKALRGGGRQGNR
ncbi:MAG: S1C family serine protease [Planctomycetaceae bacterium]